jgi:hypothetical protein
MSSLRRLLREAAEDNAKSSERLKSTMKSIFYVLWRYRGATLATKDFLTVSIVR